MFVSKKESEKEKDHDNNNKREDEEPVKWLAEIVVKSISSVSEQEDLVVLNSV